MLFTLTKPMQIYRLNIHRHGKFLGHFESGTAWSLEAVSDIAERLVEADGYRLELMAAKDERRLLESGPDGVRVLYSAPVFVTTPLKK